MQARAEILHVEDDASLQNLVRAALERLGGYTVRTAASGGEALAVAEQCVPRLLLLDLDLPDMSGIATLRALRSLPGLAEVPAVLLTAVCGPQVQLELRPLGVREILQKPFRPRLLVQAVGRILGASGQ